MSLLWVLVGIALLLVASDIAVAGAAGLARQWRVSELVIGLTVVAIGTSLPELATTLMGAVSAGGQVTDEAGMAIGNVLGSNFFLLTALLGGSALLRTLPVPLATLKREGGVLTGLTLLLFWAFWSGSAGRLLGIVLVLTYLGYIVTVVRQERAERPDVVEEDAPEPSWIERVVGHLPMPAPAQMLALVLVGLSGVVAGATLVVRFGVGLAEGFGVPGALIGLFVGATTSLPEAVVSARAASRGTTAIAIGNLLGSSITNLGLCLGTAAIVSPLALDPLLLKLDYPFLLASTFTALILLWEHEELTSKEGATLIVLYLLYLTVRVGLG